MCNNPAAAIARKNNTMTGPKNAATIAVPRRCTANNAIRISTVIGTTYSPKAGVTSLRPSTAERTEIAGVMTLSPRNIAAPMMPSIKTNGARLPTARNASAINESVPPSPLLSARKRISTYLTVTTRINAQRIMESTPSTISRVTGPDPAAATAASRNA